MSEEPIEVDITKNLNEVKGALISVAEGNQSPAVNNLVRQCCDNLDAAYLFYTSLMGVITAQNEQVEEKLAKGDVVQFPGKAPEDGKPEA